MAEVVFVSSLATQEDEDLRQNMDVIDCFATDHAPHTLEEKDLENPLADSR
ncbi:MAG: hypothetical protein U0X92_08365 [Anaerolineales bacterium]